MKRLMVWVGPVTSAKSTGALGMAHRLRHQGRKVLLVRPKRSIRGYECAGTFKTKDSNCWPSVDVHKPMEIHLAVKEANPDVVWIDEPTLFVSETTDGIPPWLFKVVQKLREKHMVLISGIAATSEMEVFGHSFPLLLAVADEIIQCKGDCGWCDSINTATRSIYLGDEEKTTQDKIGGLESYLPACPECWEELMKHPASVRRRRLKTTPLPCKEISE